ncbi:MAG: glycosyltransferase, partial [Steroidobacteraceae bacterium]|nr:glycosyltransferase [Steroidobacteraceae bacterium]
MKVMMLGPFPRAPERIDGGVAAAITYLSRELVAEPGIDLIGVRVAPGAVGSSENSAFDWPIVDLSLGRGSVSTFYFRQRRRFAEILREFQPDIVHAHGADVSGVLAVGSGYPSVVTVHGLLAE